LRPPRAGGKRGRIGIHPIRRFPTAGDSGSGLRPRPAVDIDRPRRSELG
jgi:hypothetical protein